MAKKYIDAGRLKELIDAKYKEFTEKAKKDCPLQYQYMADGLDIAEQFVDSLQQEQPEVELDEETETWISTHIKVETGGIQLVNADELAKTVKEWGKCIARHFYELGLKAKEE